MQLNFIEILDWSKTTDEEKLKQLWQMADLVRHKNVGDAVHLRGLIEISNICHRACAYCGINANNNKIERYRMTADEIVVCALKAASFGYGTVVLQAGEDPGITAEFITDIIKHIKKETPLAVTLSLGERSNADLVEWKNAGANRYLLRFETSDTKLYNLIHPPLLSGDFARDRFAILRELKKLNYEVGSGVMIGIPGQSYETLARDILCFTEYDLDMIGVGPYLPHPDTLLGCGKVEIPDLDAEEQVPNSELMTYKVLALTRIMCPEANIPSTTALATINKKSGRELGLMRGANIFMPNMTPPIYRAKYTIYPNKACVNDTPEICNGCMRRRIESIGRTIGVGVGSRVVRNH